MDGRATTRPTADRILRGAIALAASSLLTAACSSIETVDAARDERAAERSGGDRTVDSETANAAISASPDSPTSAGRAVGATPSEQSGRAGHQRDDVDPRISASTIPIGIEYLDLTQLSTFGGALTGADFSLAGDPKRQAQAFVDYINAHGGVAGRKLAPVFKQYNLQNAGTASSRSQEAQAACTQFTQDHHVFMMMTVRQGDGTLDCAKRTNTIFMPNYPTNALDAEGAKQYPDYYTPATPSYDRKNAGLVRGLVTQRRFFNPGSKLGLMIVDEPAARRAVTRSLLPALAAEAGIRSSDVVQVVYPDPISSPWTNYVLQMQQAGVTNVIFPSGVGGGPPVVAFMQAAENARYRPLYGLTDEAAPGGLLMTVPREQYSRVHGVVSQPSFIGLEQETSGTRQGRTANAADNRCREILRSVGEPENGGALGGCDQLFFFWEVLQRSPTLTVGGFRQAAEAMGTSFTAAATWATRFGPTRHDGAELQRDYAFDASCDCYRFFSETYPVPG